MRPGRGTVTLFAAGSLAILALAISGRGGRDAPAGGVPVAFAERGTLEVTLVEPGALEAQRSVTLASEIRSNRAKIVSLLAEGAWVRPGDVVVRFDRTPFEEELSKRTMELRDAEAAAATVTQERKLQIAKGEQSLESARHLEKIGRLNLEAYEKGTGALNVREAEVKAAEQHSELERARGDLADMAEMLARGFVSQGEIDRQRQKVEELGRRSHLQRDRLEAAREVVYPRELERTRTELEEAKNAVARAEIVLYHTREFYRAAEEAAERKVEAAREALRLAEEELDKTELAAPIEGFLVLQEIPLETGKRKPQVGDSVWSGHPMAVIPDLSRMVVRTRVREVDLHRIQEGLAAEVAVEAYPDLVLRGRVEHVGSLARASRESPWKFFGVRLSLDRNDSRLRPGMSVRVSFLLDSASDAIVVPLDAIFVRGDENVCYVRRGGGVWEQAVALGKRNDTHVEIRSGIDAGEELLLAAPESSVRRAPREEPHA